MRYKKLFTQAEPHASTVSLLENLECDNIKEIIIINKNKVVFLFLIAISLICVLFSAISRFVCFSSDSYWLDC